MKREPWVQRIGARLQVLIDQGKAYLDGNEAVGIAADGVEVSLGDVCGSNSQQVERYLESHPSPDTW